MKPLYFDNKRKPKYRFSQDENGLSYWCIGGIGLLMALPIIGLMIKTYFNYKKAKKMRSEASEKIKRAKGKEKAGNYLESSKLQEEAVKLDEEANKLYEKTTTEENIAYFHDFFMKTSYPICHTLMELNETEEKKEK